jgi:Holliday junction resolvase-like predicted endonuclease
MTYERKSLGNLSESLVADFVVNKGYTIESKNWTHSTGELDLVAIDGLYLAIIEVRSISTSFLGHPFQNVPLKKQKKIALCTQAYLRQRRKMLFDRYRDDFQSFQKFASVQMVRFDVAGVKWERSGVGKEVYAPEIFYQENAFYSGFAF